MRTREQQDLLAECGTSDVPPLKAFLKWNAKVQQPQEDTDMGTLLWWASIWYPEEVE